MVDDSYRQAEAGIHTRVREIGQRQVFGTDPFTLAWSHCVATPDCRSDPPGVLTQYSADLIIGGDKLPQFKDWVTTIMPRRAGQHQP